MRSVVTTVAANGKQKAHIHASRKWSSERNGDEDVGNKRKTDNDERAKSIKTKNRTPTFRCRADIQVNMNFDTIFLF